MTNGPEDQGGVRQVISRNLFATSDDPARLLIVLVVMMSSGLLGGQLLHDPDAIEPHAVVRVAGALGALFIWLLTFFMQPLVAASVYNAISTNSKSVKIALAAIALLTKKKWLEYGMYGVAAVGLGVGALAALHI